MARHLLIALLALVLLAPVVRAQSGAITADYLEEQIALVDFGGQAGVLSVTVIEADGTVFSAATGEHGDGAAPGPDDLYRVGSTTKTFTAALVLTLVAEGLIDLDAPASASISRVAVPPDVTVRQLLRHTSGLANYQETENYYTLGAAEPERIWTPEEILALVADAPTAEPGSEFRYANTNYVLLGIMLEEVTGMPYHDLLRERILEPLGMENTYLAGYETGPEPAVTFEYGETGLVAAFTPYTAAATSAWAAGGIVSTAADLHVFMTALFAGEIVPPELVAEMSDPGEWGYGFGLMPFGDLGNVLGHLGSMPGYATLLAHAPETGRTALWALTNESVDPGPAQYELLNRLGEG